MSVKLGEWVGLGWVLEGVLYCIQNESCLKLSVTFLLGRICFFFSEAHYVICVSVFVLTFFFGVSILFKVSTVIKIQDRYICMYSYIYICTQLLKTFNWFAAVSPFPIWDVSNSGSRLQPLSFFLLAGGRSTVGSR